MATTERLHALAVACRASEATAADDREARDAEIDEADREGMGIREIARATALSPSQVQRIIARRAMDRQG